MATSTPFGPGTMTLGTTPTEFGCEIMGGAVTHEYEEVLAARTPLCGTEKPASRVRRDGLTFTVENDMTATGLYKYLITNDLTTVQFAYTPNTAHVAKWTGSVQLTLPDQIGADEFGAPLVSTVTWAGVGAFTFTVGTLLEDETRASEDEAVAA